QDSGDGPLMAGDVVGRPLANLPDEMREFAVRTGRRDRAPHVVILTTFGSRARDIRATRACMARLIGTGACGLRPARRSSISTAWETPASGSRAPPPRDRRSRPA